MGSPRRDGALIAALVRLVRAAATIERLNATFRAPLVPLARHERRQR